jgi:hypothetical protein
VPPGTLDAMSETIARAELRDAVEAGTAAS